MPSEPKPSERKLTEDLLAGFDRTGRTPKTPPVAKDFVDFHRKPLERTASPPRMAEPTFVIRPKRGVPAWLPWVGVVLLMLVGGAAVAWAVRPTSNATPEPLPSFSLPSPTVTSTATAAPAAEPSAPVEPVEPVATPTASASASGRPRPTAPPRSGFVREL